MQIISSRLILAHLKVFRRILCILCLYSVLSAALLYADDSSAEADAANKRLAQQAMANLDYRVLPGDIYQLGYTIGQTTVSYQIVVDTSGIIRIANLGSVNTNGKTFLAVKRQVEALISQNYPLSVVQFVLTAPSTFTVTVKGEVVRTTEVKAWGLTRASQVISGLLTDFASTRYLSITGSSGKRTEYDLFQAIRFGDMAQDPYVSPGDVITVSRVKRRVTISGAVERQGTYELADQETLTDLITVYGSGYTDGADRTQAKVTRTTNNEDGTTRFDSFFIALNNKESTSVQLQHLDKVYINDQKDLQPFVYLDIPSRSLSDISDNSSANKDGAEQTVTATVSIPFNKGDDLLSIVRERLPLFTKPWVDAAGAYIFRQGKQIPVNLNPFLFDQSYREVILLEAEDRIVVPEIKQTVSVTGAVVNPGVYPYTPGRTFDYYIGLAGGFDYQRNTGRAVTITDVYGKKLVKNAVIGPNTLITAKSNAFMYNFNIYAPLITVTATIVTATIAILTFISKK